MKRSYLLVPMLFILACGDDYKEAATTNPQAVVLAVRPVMEAMLAPAVAQIKPQTALIRTWMVPGMSFAIRTQTLFRGAATAMITITP